MSINKSLGDVPAGETADLNQNFLFSLSDFSYDCLGTAAIRAEIYLNRGIVE
jgi:hypothetical protein